MVWAKSPLGCSTRRSVEEFPLAAAAWRSRPRVRPFPSSWPACV